LGGDRFLGAGRVDFAFLLLLLLFAAVLYSPSWHGDWVYDDHPAIVANHSLADLGGRAAEALQGRRTLTDFTFALNRAAGGLDPTGYHAVNLLLHGGNAFLVFLLGGAVLRRLGDKRYRRSAAAAALVFVAHPLFSQAVAYAAQRYTTLAAFFYLLGAYLYVSARERASLRRGILAFLSAFLAMRSKEIAFTLPLAILFLELLLFRGEERKVRAALPFLLLLPLIPLSLLFSGEGVGRNLPAESLRAFREAPLYGRWEYFITQWFVVVRYAGLLLWPAGLTVDRMVPLIPSPAAGKALLSLLLLLGAIGGAWALRRWAPVFLFGIVWFLLALSVESSFVPIRDVMVEHRAYLPSVGLLLVAGWGIARAGRFRMPVLLLLLLLLGTATFRRAAVWAGSVPLWKDAASKAPGEVRPWINLGLAYRTVGRYGESEEAYRKALALRPDLVEVHYGLGRAWEGMGRAGEALGAYAEARRIAPDYGPAYDAEALLLRRMGRVGEAAALLREALSRAGPERGRWSALGELLLAQNPGAAADAFARSLRLDPRYEPAHLGLARALLAMGRAEEAARNLEEELRRQESPHLWNGLGLVRRALGDREGAASAFRRALVIDPGLVEARNNLRKVEGAPEGR